MQLQPVDSYRKFCKRAEMQKAINTLRGLVSGIKADSCINEKEINELINWCTLHEQFRDFSPFNDLLPVVWAALEDGVLDDNERDNILWLCSRVTSWCDDNLSAIQYLHGFLHGLLADGELNDAEIFALQNWITETDFLRGTYPYDELDSLLTSILADRIITDDERNYLIAFISDFVDISASYNINGKTIEDLKKQYAVQGVCACCPEIEFPGKLFCFTGESNRAPRVRLAHEVSIRGGLLRDSVSGKTDYLIVGNDRNPCWAFACYGRKIEQALNLRKNGAKIQIINEIDFWDAIGE